MRAVVISGLSGAGKSSAVKTLEDLGFYCIDNLPVPLLRSYLDLTRQSTEEIQKIALVIDARDKQYISRLPSALKELKKEGTPVELTFLEASDDVLARRFSETRHRHPLSPNGSALEGIQKERKLLASVRELADTVIDTTDFTTRDLRNALLRSYGTTKESPTMAVKVTSFGYKYGLPSTADLVFDVRFLPNPFFRDDLKSKTGADPKVIDFVMRQADTAELLSSVGRLMNFLIPRFAREGKSYVHIAIGCTGGRHRSVVVAGEVVKIVAEMGFPVAISHRDMERE